MVMVSPSARPRPSIVPPMIPPRPYGSTTERIMPQRVDQELNDELRDLVKGNETLQKAVDELARENARDLAERAKKLADDQKALDKAAKDADAASRKKKFDDVAKEQDALARQEGDLAKKVIALERIRLLSSGQGPIADEPTG